MLFPIKLAHEMVAFENIPKDIAHSELAELFIKYLNSICYTLRYHQFSVLVIKNT